MLGVVGYSFGREGSQVLITGPILLSVARFKISSVVGYSFGREGSQVLITGPILLSVARFKISSVVDIPSAARGH